MRALVLSGGASKGAFQKGCLDYILGDLNKQYDILLGVSVGALNAAMLAMFDNNSNQQALEFLSKIWNNVSTKQIYKRWFPFGKLHALWQRSLYDSSPLEDLVNKEFNLEQAKSTGKQLSVGAVSLTAGTYSMFDMSHPEFNKCVIASASFPTMFKPVFFDNQWWSDGGVREATPIKAAIEAGATEIDVIFTSSTKEVKEMDNNSKTLKVALRTLELMIEELMEDDISKALMYNKLVECGAEPDKRSVKINVLRPEGPLTSDVLNFNQDKVQPMIKIGYDTAKKNFKG